MSNKQDPWEKKYAENKRFSRNNRSYSLGINFKILNLNAVALNLCAIVVMMSEVPSIPPKIRLAMSLIGLFLLLIISAFCEKRSELDIRFFKSIPVLSIIVTLVYSIMSYFWADNKTIAWGEIIRILLGGAVFIAMSRILNKDGYICYFMYLFSVVSLVSIYDISRYANVVGLGSHFSADSVSVLGTHETVGSLLAIILPICLAFLLTDVLSKPSRLFIIAISLVIGFAWIMVRCRSAWIGGAVGLLLMTLLSWKFMRSENARRNRPRDFFRELINSPLLLIICGLIIIAFVGGLAPALSSRTSSLLRLLEDTSMEGRLAMWKGALRMLSEKPILGWGLGSYLLLQGFWTNMGDGPEQVMQNGTGHQNIAHNHYVQWAADTGTIGLFLFLMSVFAMSYYAIRALMIARKNEDKILIIGCLSSLTAALVEVMGSPAFQFCGVWTIFWSIAGILVAISFKVTQESNTRTTSWPLIALAIVSGVICAGLVWYGHRLRNPQGIPRGVFELVEQTRGPYHPGDEVRWRAVYRDSKGVDRGSNPATRWVLPVWATQGETQVSRPVNTPKWTLSRTKLSDSFLLHGYSEMTVRLPANETGMIQIQAFFYDEFGRKYSSFRFIDVVKK